jgi:hypothetical protein
MSALIAASLPASVVKRTRKQICKMWKPTQPTEIIEIRVITNNNETNYEAMENVFHLTDFNFLSSSTECHIKKNMTNIREKWNILQKRYARASNVA